MIREASNIKVRAEIGHLLNSVALTGTGVEVGVFRGDFAEQVLQTWRGIRLLLVDPWKHLSDYRDNWNFSDEKMEQNFQFTLDRLKMFSRRVEVLRMRSEEAAEHVPDSSCDFIYIDGNHSFIAASNDLRAWYPKLRQGGLMSGHDYFDARTDENLQPIRTHAEEHISRGELTSYGVKSAVDDFLANLDVTLFIIQEPWPSWYFFKP